MIYRRVIFRSEIVFAIEKQKGILTIISAAPWLESEFLEMDKVSLSDVILLPISDPEKVVGVAQNYNGVSGVIGDGHEPLIFLKSPTSIIGPKDEIRRPFENLNVWGESELAIIVGRRKIEASGHSRPSIFGYSLANDVTIENTNGNDHHLAKSKSPDTFCPLADFVDTSFVPKCQSIRGFQNGLLIREAQLSDRILEDQAIVDWVDRWMTLAPGDIVLTGAPPRVGDRFFLNDGDIYSVEIEDLGCIENVFKD